MRRRGCPRQLAFAAATAAVALAAGCTTPATPTSDTDVGSGDVPQTSRADYQYRWGRDQYRWGRDDTAASNASAVDSTPLRLLREWDARRAAAYAEGSIASLRRLYVPGSGAGEVDVAMLREYVARDVRVVGMEMQILRVEVLDHRPGEWRLRVTDRLHHAVAVTDEGRVRLPRDRSSTHDLRLVLDGRWRVAEVRTVRDGS